MLVWCQPVCRAARITIAVCTAILMSCAAPGRAAADDGPRLTIDAGIAGTARAGRWLPVRVSIENDGETGSENGGENVSEAGSPERRAPVAGELVVEWGDARLHREVTLAVPSRFRAELYLRTSDPRGTVTARLVAGGRTLASTETSLRLANFGESLAICIGSIPAGNTAPCSVVAPGVLPQSMRGYDAVDSVIADGGREAALAPQQRTALRQWRTYHDLESRQLLSRAPRASRDTAADGAGLGAGRSAIGIYLLTLLVAAIVWLLRPGAVRWSYGAFGAAATAAILCGIAAGRLGAWPPIVVRHATSMLQVDGGSVVTMRAAIEYPAFDRYRLRADLLDAAVQSRYGDGTEQWTDDSGAPVRSGIFGSGGMEEVELEAVNDFAPLVVTAAQGVTRIVNTSPATLHNCRFPAGYSPASVGALAAGASVEARQVGVVDAPFFSCDIPDPPPVGIADARYPVRMAGVTVVSVHVASAAAGGTP